MATLTPQQIAAMRAAIQARAGTIGKSSGGAPSQSPLSTQGQAGPRGLSPPRRPLRRRATALSPAHDIFGNGWLKF